MICIEIKADYYYKGIAIIYNEMEIINIIGKYI